MKAREEIRENHKMRHNIWKKYLKIICSWILIFSICGLSLNVTEASGAGVEMERESQETVDFISDIENQETEPEILADDEQLSESEQIVESEKEPENPVEIEDSSDQIWMHRNKCLYRVWRKNYWRLPRMEKKPQQIE